MSGHEQDTDVQDSTPNANGPDGAAGEMGVSSERVGASGPGQTSTDGVRDTSPDPSPEESPEESPDDDVTPEGIAPAAGYPSADPRSEDKPYEP